MFKILKNFKSKEWLCFFFVVVFIVGQVWLDLKLPGYMSEITAKLTAGNISMADIWSSGGMMMLCALGSLLLAIATGFLVAKMASKLSERTRAKLFAKINSFSMAEINKFSTASLITRSTNDITQIQMFVAMGLQVLIKAPILATWAIITILGKSWEWSLATGVAVAILLVIIAIFIFAVVPKFKKIQIQTDDVNRVARENLTGLKVVRAYNAEEFEQEKFAKANNALSKTTLFIDKSFAILPAVMTLIMNGLSLAIYIIGAILINAKLFGLATATTPEAVEAIYSSSATLFGDMVVFMSYAMQVIMSFIMLIMVFIMLPRAIVSARRINEVMDTKVSIVSGNYQNGTKRPKKNPKHKVEFKNVSFKYPNAEEYVLKDVSFTAEKGETIAFIGSTGSGKSTLINLIPRFYDATDGEIIIDGVSIKDYPLNDLYDKLGYVPQQAKILTGTVNSNITLGTKQGKKASAENIYSALEISQSSEFVNKMKDGLETNISQGGSNLSGGQKQRLSIARAIAKDPEIFIFDDTFSALDYKTDKKLRKEISTKLKDSTCFIVAQRIGTIKNADKIIVLDSGNVVGMGKHKDLMKNCEVYKEIALSQLSKEELE